MPALQFCSSTALQLCSQWCRAHLHTAMGPQILACSQLRPACTPLIPDVTELLFSAWVLYACFFLQGWLAWLIWMVSFQGSFAGIGPLEFFKNFISVFSLGKFWSVKDSCLKSITSLYNLFHFLSWLWSADSFITYQSFLSSSPLPSPSIPFRPLPSPPLGELQKTCYGESL